MRRVCYNSLIDNIEKALGDHLAGGREKGERHGFNGLEASKQFNLALAEDVK